MLNIKSHRRTSPIMSSVFSFVPSRILHNMMRIVIIFTEESGENVYRINEKCDVRVIINQDFFLLNLTDGQSEFHSSLSFHEYFLSHLNCDWWLLTSPHISHFDHLPIHSFHSSSFSWRLNSNYSRQLQMRWEGATLCGIIDEILRLWRA